MEYKAHIREMSDKTFYKFKEFIESHIGICIPESKRVLVESRLLRRLRALDYTCYDDYANYLFSERGEVEEVPRFVECITTNKTDFFREEDHFTFLNDIVLPELVKRHNVRDIRIWSAASSIGAEAYTLAMVVDNYIRLSPGIDFKILATDISERVLNIGRSGIYSENDLNPVPQVYKKRYCLKSRDRETPTIRITPYLRSRVLFQHINLKTEAYMVKKKYHVIFLRNVMIYFNKETQTNILYNLYKHLHPDGYLFLGHSENLPSNDLPFKRVGPSIYVREDKT